MPSRPDAGFVRDTATGALVVKGVDLSGLSALARTGGWLPATNAIAATVSREAVSLANIALTSGTLRLAGGLVLPAGRQITGIGVMSGGVAATTPTNQWFSLYDVSRNLLAVTTDDTTTAWAATTAKTLNLQTPYTPTADLEVYVGVVVAATTPPQLSGANTTGAVAGLGNPMGGNSTAGLTTPATAPATAAVPGGSAPFLAWVY